MLDLNYIKENQEKVINAFKKRQIKFNIDNILKLDNKRRQHIKDIENIYQKKNQANITISKLTSKDKEEVVTELRPLVQKEKVLKTELEIINGKLNNILYSLPNIPQEDVRVGKSEADNDIVKKIGAVTKFNFEPKDHLLLSEKLDLIDVKRAAKVSGSRFGYIKNAAAQIEIGLINYAFETLIKKEFKPVFPPVLIKEEAMKGMGYIEGRGEQETYHLKDDAQYFVGTAEQAIGPMHMNEIMNDSDLPVRYAAFSTCFRREAGSYGKDTRGILRVHQFDKIEMFSYTRSEDSNKEQDLFLEIEEQLVKSLEIPYRIVKVCTADLSFPSSRTYDLECWIPSERKYRETHSNSNCTDFQSRRLNIKYKTNKGNKYVHTVNGTAFAMGRIIIAILENFQQKDGTIILPKVLQKYCGIKIIK